MRDSRISSNPPATARRADIIVGVLPLRLLSACARQGFGCICYHGAYNETIQAGSAAGTTALLQM